MNINGVAEILLRRLNNGDVSAESRYEMIDAIVAIQSAVAYKLTIDCYTATKMEGEWVVDSVYVKTYPSVEVQFDSVSQQYYSLLPVQPLGLPKGRGIRNLAPIQAPQKPFFWMDNGEAWLLSDLPASHTSFWIDSEKIYYKNINANVKTVTLSMIPMRADEVPDDLVYEIIDLAMIQFLKTAQIAEDKITNQNPNIRQSGNGQ